MFMCLDMSISIDCAVEPFLRVCMTQAQHVIQWHSSVIFDCDDDLVFVQ